MSRLRSRIRPERVIGVIHVGSRSAVIFEQLTYKVMVWIASRTPSGEPALATAARVFAIPNEAWGDFAVIAARIAAFHAREAA